MKTKSKKNIKKKKRNSCIWDFSVLVFLKENKKKWKQKEKNISFFFFVVFHQFTSLTWYPPHTTMKLPKQATTWPARAEIIYLPRRLFGFIKKNSRKSSKDELSCFFSGFPPLFVSFFGLFTKQKGIFPTSVVLPACFFFLVFSVQSRIF